MISAAYAATDAATSPAFYATPDFWVLIAFLVVIGFAWKPLSRAIGAGLDSRANQIKGKLDEARRLREEAQALLAEYQRKQRDALSEAEAILGHAREEAARLKAEAERNLEESVRRRQQQAVDRIAQAETQAVAEVRNLAVDIAIRASGQLIASSMSPQKSNALIDGAIKDLPGKLH